MASPSPAAARVCERYPAVTWVRCSTSSRRVRGPSLGQVSPGGWGAVCGCCLLTRRVAVRCTSACAPHLAGTLPPMPRAILQSLCACRVKLSCWALCAPLVAAPLLLSTLSCLSDAGPAASAASASSSSLELTSSSHWGSKAGNGPGPRDLHAELLAEQLAAGDVSSGLQPRPGPAGADDGDAAYLGGSIGLAASPDRPRSRRRGKAPIK